MFWSGMDPKHGETCKELKRVTEVNDGECEGHLKNTEMVMHQNWRTVPSNSWVVWQSNEQILHEKATKLTGKSNESQRPSTEPGSFSY